MVCKVCSRLWARFHDRREDVVWYKDLGAGALDVIAADVCCERIVMWACTGMPATAQGWANSVLIRLLGRRKTDLGHCLETVVAALRQPVEQPSELAAIRRLELITMCTSVLQAASSSLPVVKLQPVAAEQLGEACARHSERRTEFSYLGRNSDVLKADIRRKAQIREAVLGAGASLVQTNDLMPLIEALAAEPLPGEARGYARGQRRRVGWQSLARFRRLATQPLTPLVLSMPGEQWNALDAALDPVSLLAASVEACLQAADLDPQPRYNAVLEEAELMPSYGTAGARISRSSMVAFEELQQSLRKNKVNKFDQMSARLLSELVFEFQRNANGDCNGPPCACAAWQKKGAS